MKNNYLNRVFKNGLKALAFLCVFGYTNMNAQTEDVSVVITAATTTAVDASGVPFAATLTTATVSGTVTYFYPADTKVRMTGTATLAGGATFNVSFDVKPISSGQKVAYNSTGWGVNAGADTNTFRASTGGSATIDNIQTSNYSAGLSASQMSSLTFTNSSVAIANNAADRFTYVVSGTEYNAPDLFATTPFNVNLLTYGPGLTGATPLTSLNSFVIKTKTGNTSASDRWNIESLTVKVTVDISTLGVADYKIASNNGLIVSPNPVVDTVSLNMTINSATIIDMTGRTVKTFSSPTDKLDVSSILPGTYILKVTNQEGTVFTKKLIK